FCSQSLRRFTKAALTCRIKPRLLEKLSPLSVSQSSRKPRIPEVKKLAILTGVLLSLALFPVCATQHDDAFQKIAHDYIEQYLRANPEDATELGDHRFDGELTDYLPEARAKELATQKEFRDKLSAIDGSQLTGPNSVDLRILKENIDYQVFRGEE